VASGAEAQAAVAEIGAPAVLKTAGFGYDGKGQEKVETAGDAAAAWQRLDAEEAILEAWVDYEREVSVVGARGTGGDFAHWGVLANDHENHVLDVTTAPAPVPAKVTAEAVELARSVLETLDVVGVLCVEMFLTREGRLLINEMAPRPHNSGHLTLEASPTSQFEQQLRAVCGLPLGETAPLRPAAMANLLGDLWQGGEPDWAAALAVPGVALHLYGKKEARPGRKMGHLTALAKTPEESRDRVLAARRALRPAPTA
jgi:5-(carboxyamino)imidazole ribonucleotide synthase